jgi:hypothetical protein
MKAKMIEKLKAKSCFSRFEIPFISIGVQVPFRYR